jgi:hypothetical protein
MIFVSRPFHEVALVSHFMPIPVKRETNGDFRPISPVTNAPKA